MGGFFGIASKQDCMMDVFFGVDYHSHLGTRRGGMAAWDAQIGLVFGRNAVRSSGFPESRQANVQNNLHR